MKAGSVWLFVCCVCVTEPLYTNTMMYRCQCKASPIKQLYWFHNLENVRMCPACFTALPGLILYSLPKVCLLFCWLPSLVICAVQLQHSQEAIELL